MLDQQISRRNLFRNSALLGAGILLGYGAGGVRSLNAEEAKKAAELDVSLYIKISSDNEVHLVLPNIEMGQGIHTAQAMVIAEELEVNLDNVIVSDAPPLPAYGKLRTGGSISINKNFDKLIKIGATAREMLIEAASLEWQVPRDECIAKSGYVSHISSGRSFSYGELAERASSWRRCRGHALRGQAPDVQFRQGPKRHPHPSRRREGVEPRVGRLARGFGRNHRGGVHRLRLRNHPPHLDARRGRHAVLRPHRPPPRARRLPRKLAACRDGARFA